MRRRDRSTLGFAGAPRSAARSGAAGRLARLVRLTLLGAVLVAGLAAGALALYSGSGRPTAELVRSAKVVGKHTPISLRLASGRAGLRDVQIRLEGAGGKQAVVFTRELPRAGFLGSGVTSLCLDVDLDAAAAGIPEGEARLVASASDWSPLGRLRGASDVLSLPIAVDLTPPKITPLSGEHHLTRGGSALAVYRVSPDAVRSGIEVGPYRFRGRSGLFADPAVFAALFAVPHDVAPPVQAMVFAEDAAGNRARVPLLTSVKDKRFPSEQIEVSEAFLRDKIPALIEQNGMTAPADPVEGYLLVNRDLRRRTEERLHDLARGDDARPLFDGAFLQQPNTAAGSRFAEHRTYRYNGRVIDEQTHLGTDLASVKQASVLAANAGTVRFVGDLGIYGNAIVIDHGLGLSSLYAHLSQASVAPGQSVARGEAIGKTGETGLAGGDHLHYSVLVDGVHVDPVEWWDGKWIRDHIAPALAVAPAADPAAAAASAAPAGAGPADAAAPAPGASSDPAAKESDTASPGCGNSAEGAPQ